MNPWSNPHMKTVMKTKAPIALFQNQYRRLGEDETKVSEQDATFQPVTLLLE